MLNDPRETRLLSLLRQEGPLSRLDLHRRMGLRPNTVGEIAERLLRAGLLREGEPMVEGPGRPRVPLEIDSQRRRVAGLALEPGRASLVCLNLQGLRVGGAATREADPGGIVEAGRDLLSALDFEPVVALGVSVTGFIDTPRRTLLMSSVTPGDRPVSLQPLYEAAGDRRVVLENDLQALAVQWVLTHEAESAQDVLLVYVRDGAIGAAVLVHGRPIAGCVMGGNEIGHTRLPIDTDRCYCGHTGCLERVFSTPQLHRVRCDDRGSLASAAAAFDGHDQAVRTLAGHLGLGIANATNLIRPSRLVLASEFNRYAAFTGFLLDEIRSGLLNVLADRVRIDLWDRPAVSFAEAAGWLALASLYREEWLPRDVPAPIV